MKIRKYLFLLMALFAGAIFITGCVVDLPDQNVENENVEHENNENENTEHENVEDFLNIKISDYTKENLREILKTENDEELSKMGFYTNAPLIASLEGDNVLKITSYAPVNLHGVEVWAKSKSSDKDFKKVAVYDLIYGFSESKFNVPGLSNIGNDLEYKFVIKNEPFWDKINTITKPLYVGYSQSKDNYWSPISHKAAREAGIIGITLSYMFNHKNYADFLKDWNNGGYKDKAVPGPFPGMYWYPSAPFKNDDGSPLNYEIVLDKALNRGKLIFSFMSEEAGAGGLASGDKVGYKPNLYENFTKYSTLPFNGTKQSQIRSYVVDTLFHEIGHTMGYSHPSNGKGNGTMTYGGGWTICNYYFLNDLVAKGDLPVPLDGKWSNNINFPF